MANILFIKTSSLGDVIHHMPAIAEARRHLPDARFAWVVEEAFAPLVRLHPAVDEVIPVAARRWRRAPLSASTWTDVRDFVRHIRSRRHDEVVDTQGLLRTALMARLAHGPCARLRARGRDRFRPRGGEARRSRGRTLRRPAPCHRTAREAVAGGAMGCARLRPRGPRGRASAALGKRARAAAERAYRGRHSGRAGPRAPARRCRRAAHRRRAVRGRRRHRAPAPRDRARGPAGRDLRGQRARPDRADGPRTDRDRRPQRRHAGDRRGARSPQPAFGALTPR